MVDGLSFCVLHCYLCHLCKSARRKKDSLVMLDRTESTGGLRLYAWVLQAVKDASDYLSTVGKSNLNSPCCFIQGILGMGLFLAGFL